jgi:hypothetical protein
MKTSGERVPPDSTGLAPYTEGTLAVYGRAAFDSAVLRWPGTCVGFGTVPPGLTSLAE